MAIALSIAAMMVVWAPMMALADSGNSQAPADPPGLSEGPPGNSAEAPGQEAKSESTTTLTEAPPGNSATAPGQTKTDTPPAPPAGSNAGGNAGNSTSSGGSSDKSTPSTSNKGGNGNNVPADNLNDGVGGGVGNSENQDKDRPNVGNGEGKGQIPADDCTNKHQGADGNKGGANQNPGPYDNTCDGRPSENGQGGGNAKGRPCQGCVGNADDKNPPGQFPNGASDGNKGNGKGNGKNRGYECDDNNGVGKGNPAHTGCTNPPPCSSWTVSVVLDGGTISQSVPSTLHSGSNTVSGVTTVSMTVSAPANHTPASDSDSANLPTSEPCTAALSVDFSPNDVCPSWTLTATVTNGTVRAPHVAGSQSASGATQNVVFDAATGFSADGTATGATSITRSAVFSGHPTCSANVSAAFSEIGGSIIDCDGDGIPDGVDPDISSCSPPPPTCPVDADQNAGEEIPEGESAESFCELDEVDPEAITCPDDATKNAGLEIPEGQTETSFCVADSVLGEIIDRDPKPGLPEVAGEVLGKAEPQAAVLPFTGGSVLPLLIVSLTMLGAGGATLYRRREASEQAA